MKGQYEAMGLAVIVILVSVGLFLFLFFGASKTSDFADRYNNEQLAQNILDAALKSSASETCDESIASLIEDVVVLHRDICGVPSELLMEQAFDAILGETLERQDIKYEFNISSKGYNYKRATCERSTSQTDRPGQQPLRFFPSLVDANVTLWICIS